MKLMKDRTDRWNGNPRLKPFVCAVLPLIIIHCRPASSEVREGTWLLANRVAVQVFECSGQLCGRTEILIRDPQLSFDGRC